MRKKKREIARDTRFEKTRVTRVRSYKELRELESRKRAFRENIYKIGHLRFEEAFELSNLDLTLVAVIRIVLIFIYIQKFNARYYSTNSRFFKTHIIKSIILRKYEQCFPNTTLF